VRCDLGEHDRAPLVDDTLGSRTDQMYSSQEPPDSEIAGHARALAAAFVGNDHTADPRRGWSGTPAKPPAPWRRRRTPPA
jgi:hypothetical protein